MVNTIIFGGLWLAFVIYAFGFAPPDQPDTLDLIQNLASGQWDGINPWIVTLFNLMGIWPLVYGAVILRDGVGQRVPAGLFWGASFGVGAFAILPYLALRRSPAESEAELSPPGKTLRVMESRWVSGLALLGSLALLSYGVMNQTSGDWADFFNQWQTSRFIHVMSLDFCALTLLYPVLQRADLRRRGGSLPWLGLSLIPLLGPALYGVIRPAIAAPAETDNLPATTVSS